MLFVLKLMPFNWLYLNDGILLVSAYRIFFQIKLDAATLSDKKKIRNKNSHLY
jgi:hypothetical protein